MMSHTVTAPAGANTAVDLAHAWEALNRLRAEQQGLPDALAQATQRCDAAAITRVFERAARLDRGIIAATLVARQRAVTHWTAEIRRTQAEAAALREAGEEARREYSKGFTVPRDEQDVIIPPPPVLAAWQRAQEAVSDAQVQLVEARQQLDTDLANAISQLQRNQR
jgi:hypothetical protein